MVAEINTNLKRKNPAILRRALKATAEGAILYAVYFVLSQFLAPLSEFVPGFQQIVETFVTVYIILIIVAELTSGSILQHFFNATKALFVIAYLMVSLGTGIFSLAFQGLNFVVDIRLFLIMAMLLGLVGLAKSVLQTINYVNEKAELALT
jgi:F0F1-type ATP synthase assembly protein I